MLFCRPAKLPVSLLLPLGSQAVGLVKLWGNVARCGMAEAVLW